MRNAARLFTCALCRCQVVLCRRCDHGNIYCSQRCSGRARRRSVRRAGRRYQDSRRGRHKHAERQRHYRKRRRVRKPEGGRRAQKVTHHPLTRSSRRPVVARMPAGRKTLEADGGPLWRMLLEVLRPQVVLLSAAKDHLGRIDFNPISEWRTARVFERTKNGALRKRPYKVMARWYEVGGARSLCVFGQAAQRPFGLLSDDQKRETGTMAQEIYGDGG